jgi:hypothetical protein
VIPPFRGKKNPLISGWQPNLVSHKMRRDLGRVSPLLWIQLIGGPNRIPNTGQSAFVDKKMFPKDAVTAAPAYRSISAKWVRKTPGTGELCCESLMGLPQTQRYPVNMPAS